jgi:hypothetical protein
MLSKAPKQQEQEAPAGGGLESDMRIASSLLTQSVLSPEGSQSVATALQSPEPIKALAVIVAQIMEMAITESMNTDTPMDPSVWLMDGGAIDDSAQDFMKVAEANGVDLPPTFVDDLVDQVAEVVAARAEGEQQQQQGGGGGMPMEGAPQAPQLPPQQQQMGGMPA